MARSRGDGERLPLNRFYKYKVRNGDADWQEIEKIANIKLTREARNKIHLVTAAYSNFGPLYSPKHSVLSKDAKLAIQSWLSATRRLTLALTPPGTDLGEFMPRIDKKFFPRMSKLPPIGKVAFVGILAEAVSRNAVISLSEENRNGRIKQDQWAAWACLVTRELRTAGLKISGKSLDKSNGESRYVNVMQLAQSWLAIECQHYNSYETTRKAVQIANNKFGRLHEKTLLQIIMGWGSQLLPGYPGNLKQAPEEAIVSFDDFAHRCLDQAKSRHS